MQYHKRANSVIFLKLKSYIVTNINDIIASQITDYLVKMIYMVLVKFFTTTQGPARPALRGATFKHKIYKTHLKIIFVLYPITGIVYTLTGSHSLRCGS